MAKTATPRDPLNASDRLFYAEATLCRALLVYQDEDAGNDDDQRAELRQAARDFVAAENAALKSR